MFWIKKDEIVISLRHRIDLLKQEAAQACQETLACKGKLKDLKEELENLK